ncbi:hypothetical protein F2Q69_00059294 [Brassica cretica]|uniref:Uncharacterized protein n=1 Tax=Brassica cretica TaxID=69181 RepID=A0A8S9RLQ7_BRACR|nr:hypothetical protein F2Q69_00059294 [Brassica cretica]
MRSSPLESLSFPHIYLQCDIISDWRYIGVLSTTFGLHTTVNVSVDDFQIITWVQPAITTTPISWTSTSSYSVVLGSALSATPPSMPPVIPFSPWLPDWLLRYTTNLRSTAASKFLDLSPKSEVTWLITRNSPLWIEKDEDDDGRI